MSDLLHFSEHRLQEAALLIMACVYVLRVRWFIGFKAPRDRQPPTGPRGTTPAKGILYSWVNVAMPWAMESTRTQPLLYAQFIIFHLGVTAAIALSFIIPYAPQLLGSSAIVSALQIIIGAAFSVGLIRLYRRISSRLMRAISSPDDYFSLILLTVWFFFAYFSVPNRADPGGAVLLMFFLLTAFFLIYVPFSKISHYLYYPFTRFYLGRTLGHRGVYPLRLGPRPARTDGNWVTSKGWRPITANGSSAKDSGKT